MATTDTILIGGPRDGDTICVRDLPPWLNLPIANHKPVFAHVDGPVELEPMRIVAHRLEEYYVGDTAIYAYLAVGVDAADALWDVLGLSVAQRDEQRLPPWLTNNRRRIAGKLWDLAERTTAAIFDTAIRLKMRIQ